MKITHLERTVVSVPFLPGILPSFEYQEFTSSYPEPQEPGYRPHLHGCRPYRLGYEWTLLR